MGCYCGNEARIDCRKIPGRKKCDSTSGKFEICVGAGSECSIYDKDTCAGSSLVFCDDGFKTKVDCTALGFLTCASETLGATTIALCK